MNHNTGKTHCLRGHEFTPENTRVFAITGARGCKACARMTKRERIRRERERGLRPIR